MKTEDFTLITESDQETIQFGRTLGAFLKKGDVLALVGELGSGKTWLAKGIALGLGVSPSTVITSPSFALVNEYEGKFTLFHMDIYRLESLSELVSAGLEDYLYSGGVVVLEWADRWPEILPDQTLKLELLILSDHRRQINLSGRHPRVIEIIDAVKQEMAER